jgi:S1-C subfamily serine protease
VFIAVAVLALVGVAIAIVSLRRPAVAALPEPSATASSQTAAPPDPGGAVEAPGRVPKWPADPTLWKAAAAPVPATAPVAAAPVAARPAALEDVIGASLPAVALVETPGGRGTGFFVTPDTVITNAHVVDAQAYVSLKLSSGESVTGRVVQRSDALDLAAIRTADARAGQATLTLGSSRDARIGQEIFAIGSPLGLQNTVTRGIVSALRQAGSVVLVQTDAAINPGNSGGPLIDRSGRVLAVATMRMAGRAEALGFGVGAEHVRALLEGAAPLVASAGQRPGDAFTPDRPGTDDQRDSGERHYERFLVEAARRADQLDASWTDFTTDCLGGRAPATRSDRGWYALWEKFDDSKVAASCMRFLTDFQLAAREFAARMTEAADRARVAGVYPGVCRQLRQRHRLDSPEW